MGGKEYNFLWLDNKLQQLLEEPSHGGSAGAFACPFLSVHLSSYYRLIFAFLLPLHGADEILHIAPAMI